MIDRNKIGPVSRDQILILVRRRVLKNQTPVWNSSMARYVALESVPDLSPFLPEDDRPSGADAAAVEPKPLKGFTKFLIPKAKRELVSAGDPRLTRAPFPKPHRLADEPAKRSSTNSRPSIPGRPLSPPSPPGFATEDPGKKSAVKEVTEAVSQGVRLLGATSLAAGAALFGVFVLGLIDILVGAQRDAIYNWVSFFIPHEFLTLLDPVEWMGVLIVGGLVGSAASAGCGGRGTSSIASIAAAAAFFSVSIGAIFAEILAISLEINQPLTVLVMNPEAWFTGTSAFFHNLWEEPDDLLFLFGAAGEAFLISRHNYRRSEDEGANRVVDPFLRA